MPIKKKEDPALVQDGKVYPNAAPGFVPPKPSETINFDTGNRNTVEVDNQKLTKDEYLGNVANTKNLNVMAERKALLDSQAQQTQTEEAGYQKAKLAYAEKLGSNRFQKELITQKLAQSQGITSEQINAFGSNVKKPEIGSTASEVSEDLSGQESNKILKALDPNTPNREAAALGVDVLTRGIPSLVVRDAVDIMDNLLAAVKLKDTKKVKSAKEAFSQAISDIKTDIELVKLGEKSAEEVKSKIETATSKNYELWGESKRKGLTNVAYWVFDGKDLEASISNNEEDLKNMKILLARAEEQRQLKEIMGGVA